MHYARTVKAKMLNVMIYFIINTQGFSDTSKCLLCQRLIEAPVVLSIRI